jgi:hypothetical protein
MKIVYFFCYPHGPADRAGYEHQIVCLAEGLRELGVPFFGNVDYWQEANTPHDFLIRQNAHVSFRDANIVVFSSVMHRYESTHLLPRDLFNSKRCYRLVFIDWSDGVRTPGFRDEMRACDLVLKCHYNCKDALPTNFRPWAFGLSTRIVDFLSGEDGAQRHADILVNYRYEHSLRKRAVKEIIPLFKGILREDRTVEAFNDIEGMTEKDRLLWVQTGRRHYPSYRRRLLGSMACSCFGGLLREDRVYQFDSWRFWESLAAGTCAFHVDLENYGCVLPVMPINMVHYLGFNLENPTCIVDRIRRRPALLRTIGEAGRAWALANYSPRPVAERFLQWATK